MLSSLSPIRLAALLLAAAAGDAVASTPTLIWTDASAIGVQCVLSSDQPAERERLEGALCARVRALASRGAPTPVRAVAIGDPAILAPGAVTLIVQASIQPLGGGRVLAYTVRPFRVSADQNAVLHGAAPRAVAVPASGAFGSEIDTSLEAALAEVLPWRAAPRGPRQLTTRN